MGGELTVHSVPGQGSEFAFSITVSVSETSRTHPPRLPRAQLLPLTQPRELLVLDESEESRYLLREMLAPLGFTLHLAADWKTAQPLLVAHPVAAIITDWRLPDAGGTELLQDIARYVSVPVFVFTADALLETRQAALQAGAAGFLSKPLSEPELHRLLAEALALPLADANVPGGAATEDGLLPAECALLQVDERQQLEAAALTLNPLEIERMLTVIGDRLPALAPRLQAIARERRYSELWSWLGIGAAAGAPQPASAPDSASKDET